MSSSSFPPPRFVFMEVNKRCNLRCTHCDFWQRTDDDKPNYLSIDHKREILSEFASLNPNGNLVICGGEPMLDFNDYFDLTMAARERELRVLSVVNGTRIRRAEVAEKMITDGPHEISISLNSHIPEIHDETRGVKGAFEKATRAIRLLVEAKKRLGAEDTRIYVMGLIFASNYKLIDGFYDYVLNDLGADQLKLNFLQPSFGQAGETDPFFAAESGVDGDELETILQACDQKYGLGLNPAWMGQTGMYFRSLDKISPEAIARGWGAGTGTDAHICNTYERNVMIDHYGTARLCFSHMFPGRKLVNPGDLTDFWTTSSAVRARMRKCNQFCGISHSVRRESSTLKGRAKMDAHHAEFGTVPPPSRVTMAVESIKAVIGK